MKDGKKVTIVTIYDPVPNFGNRLQNYAVQNILENLNCQAETLSFEKPALTGKKKLKALAQKLSNCSLPGEKDYWRNFPARVNTFARFNKTYIKTRRIRNIAQIRPMDYYVLGSDQVWNPAWYHEGDMKKELFLLTFARPEQKVCFSPSFGVNELPEEWKPWFKEHLQTFPRLSVREEAGKQIIKDLIGQDAEILIDPTMMLDKSDWLQIAKKPKNIACDQPYILTYFIGGRSDRVNSDLHCMARQHHWQVYNLLDIAQSDLYVTGPSEFVYLISRAQLVLTDSFHACVFSFLFGKPFLVYDRQGTEGNMMSRMNTLLKTFHLERKCVDSGLPNDILECNYQHGYEVLASERQKVINYLKKAMHIQ